MSIKRYEWEDALVDAQATGLIPNGALLLALKLARAINWSPKDKRPAGLYWKNEDALEAVGASRASYFKHRQSLLETGFFVQEKGNLLPTMPEKSLLETNESLLKTVESLVDNPLSVDTFSDDVLSEQSAVSPDGSPTDSFKYVLRQGVESLPNSTSPANPVYVIDLSGVTKEVEEAPQSLLETGHNRILTPGEKKVFDDLVRIYRVDADRAQQALEIVRGTNPRVSIDDAAKAALQTVGAAVVEIEEW